MGHGGERLELLAGEAGAGDGHELLVQLLLMRKVFIAEDRVRSIGRLRGEEDGRGSERGNDQ